VIALPDSLLVELLIAVLLFQLYAGLIGGLQIVRVDSNRKPS
jgi:hypothetical protein